MTTSPPSRWKILLASLATLIVAALVLVAAVLPAEYGIDPLGTGKLLGLLALSREQPMALRRGDYRLDSAELVVRPSEWVEYSYELEEGASLLFSWQATGALETNFHAAPDDAPRGYAESYDSGAKDSGHGTYTALFTGTHGWYWENTSNEEIVLRLDTAGFFDYAHEGRYRVSGYHPVRDLRGRELPVPP